jgi:hypothetical protein
MKRILALALAATLLGSTAASARGWSGHHSYSHGSYGHYGHHYGHGDAAAAIGLGIFALGALAILSSQNADRYDAPVYERGYGPPPGYGAPPPPDAYNGYDYGYER